MNYYRITSVLILVGFLAGCQSSKFSLPKMPSMSSMFENRPKLFAKKDKKELPPPSRHFETIKNEAEIARNERLDIETGTTTPPSQASAPFGAKSDNAVAKQDRFERPEVAGADSHANAIRKPYRYDGERQEENVKEAAAALAQNWKGLDQINPVPNPLPTTQGEFSPEFSANQSKPQEIASQFSLPGIPSSNDFELPATVKPRASSLANDQTNSFSPVNSSPPADVIELKPTNRTFDTSIDTSIASQPTSPPNLPRTSESNPLLPKSSNSFPTASAAPPSAVNTAPVSGGIEYPRTAQADNSFERALSQMPPAQTSNSASFAPAPMSPAPMTPAPTTPAPMTPRINEFAVAASTTPRDNSQDFAPTTKNQTYMINNPFANEVDHQNSAQANQSAGNTTTQTRSARLPESLRTSSRGYAPGSTGRRTSF